MKPITELTKEDIKNLKIVCFDCDGVTVERGTEIEETETTLNVKTNALSTRLLEKLLKLKKHFHLDFSSGRSLLYLDRMYGKVLWDSASLTAENGIFTLIDGEVVQHEKFAPETLIKINQMKVDIRELSQRNKDIRGFEPKQFLITVHAWKEVPQIETIRRKYDTKDEFYNWWNGEAYDIGLKRLNKGTGLERLANYLRVDLSQTMSIGNGLNDLDMVKAAGIGVSTDPEVLKSDFYTTGQLHLGGEELVDRLLDLVK